MGYRFWGKNRKKGTKKPTFGVGFFVLPFQDVTLCGPDGHGNRCYEPDHNLIIFEPGTTPQDAVLLLELYKEGKDVTSMSTCEID